MCIKEICKHVFFINLALLLLLQLKYGLFMWLERISVLNYKNIEQVDLDFSPKVNCIIGKNGMGKTNLLDAVYYLSFCKSAMNSADMQSIMHGKDFFVLQGLYRTDDGGQEDIYCGLKRKQKKHFKRNKKEYMRLSEHIGLIPLIMVSPSDSELIIGGSEGRRRFIDVVISQFDRIYLDHLIRYNKALLQRNVLLRSKVAPDEEMLTIWEEMMAKSGELVYQKRKDFINEFIPFFQSYYSYISQDKEKVSLAYKSQVDQGDLLQLLKASRLQDSYLGYSTVGVHKDDLVMQLGEYPLKREGSQGQSKTYLIALKLSQFEFLKRTGSRTTPIVLLDDIFDKLDVSRVEQIVKLVAGNSFGQIFITDTNREHLDKILSTVGSSYKLFEVENGNMSERSGGNE